MCDFLSQGELWELIEYSREHVFETYGSSEADIA